MPERVQDGHIWVGAATVEIPSNSVRGANRRGTYRVPKETKVMVLEVYCSECRGDYEKVVGVRCVALDKKKSHLTGGALADQRRRPSEYPTSDTLVRRVV